MRLSDFIIFQVAMFAASLACVFLPRNGAAGVKFFYTLADDGIWKAVNVRFGIIASCVVAVFALAGVAADFAGVKGLIYFSMAETAVYCLAALYAYAFARKLYFEKFPDSPRAGGRAAVGQESCASGKLSGFERALFAFYILSTAALFFWLRGLCEPLWGETVATRFNSEGAADGYMEAGAFFTEISAILLSASALGAAGGYAASRLCRAGRGIFTPLACGLFFALSFAFLWAMAVCSVLAARENSGRLEILSGWSGLFAAAAGAFLLLSVCAAFALSSPLKSCAPAGRK